MFIRKNCFFRIRIVLDPIENYDRICLFTICVDVGPTHNKVNKAFAILIFYFILIKEFFKDINCSLSPASVMKIHDSCSFMIHEVMKS